MVGWPLEAQAREAQDFIGATPSQLLPRNSLCPGQPPPHRHMQCLTLPWEAETPRAGASSPDHPSHKEGKVSQLTPEAPVSLPAYLSLS